MSPVPYVRITWLSTVFTYYNPSLILLWNRHWTPLAPGYFLECTCDVIIHEWRKTHCLWHRTYFRAISSLFVSISMLLFVVFLNRFTYVCRLHFMLSISMFSNVYEQFLVSFREKFRKCIPPQKWLNQTTNGNARKCRSRAFQWVVMLVTCAENLGPSTFWAISVSRL
jgi:hypothetical protein